MHAVPQRDAKRTGFMCDGPQRVLGITKKGLLSFYGGYDPPVPSGDTSEQRLQRVPAVRGRPFLSGGDRGVRSVSSRLRINGHRMPAMRRWNNKHCRERQVPALPARDVCSQAGLTAVPCVRSWQDCCVDRQHGLPNLRAKLGGHSRGNDGLRRAVRHFQWLLCCWRREPM